MYVSRSSAAQHYGVTGQTIVAWADAGRIQSVRQPSGQRRYWVNDQSNSEGKPNEKKKVCYCRVSSHGQKDDLQRQIEYMRDKHPGWIVVSDIGSGLNWNRKNLRTVLQWGLQGRLESLAVAHKDRLARFGYEIIEFILVQCGVQLICDAEEEHTSKEQELVDDILAIITVFSAKIYGGRKYKKRKKNSNDPCDAHERTEENIQEMVRNVS
jgi:predicted site-specific integrase-resolvase